MFVQVFQVILQDPIRGIFLLQEQTFLGISGFLDFSSSAAQAGIPYTNTQSIPYLDCLLSSGFSTCFSCSKQLHTAGPRVHCSALGFWLSMPRVQPRLGRARSQMLALQLHPESCFPSVFPSPGLFALEGTLWGRGLCSCFMKLKQM